MPGPPPGAFPPLDFFRFKVDSILREHGFEAKPLPEANAGNVEGDTTERRTGRNHGDKPPEAKGSAR